MLTILFLLLGICSDPALSFPFGLEAVVEWQTVNVPRLVKADARGIPYAIERSVERSDFSKLRYRFGSLTREQFEALRLDYGAGRELRYQPGRLYELMDFLPPLMQALDGVTFQAVGLQGSDAWGTVYEIARGQNRFAIFYSLPEEMLNVLTDDTFSRKIQAVDGGLSRRGFARSETTGDVLARTGDIVIFSKQGRLIQASIFVDTGLYFGKIGPGSRDVSAPYRLCGSGTIEHPDLLQSQEHRIEIRRITSERLPHPLQLFEGLPVREVTLRGGPSGRAELPPEAFKDAPAPRRILIRESFDPRENCGDARVRSRVYAF